MLIHVVKFDHQTHDLKQHKKSLKFVEIVTLFTFEIRNIFTVTTRTKHQASSFRKKKIKR